MPMNSQDKASAVCYLCVTAMLSYVSYLISIPSDTYVCDVVIVQRELSTGLPYKDVVEVECLKETNEGKTLERKDTRNENT
jgi:hypothetical protein